MKQMIGEMMMMKQRKANDDEIGKWSRVGRKVVWEETREDRREGSREGGNIENWLAQVMTHSQAHFLHSSLEHQIIFKVNDGDTIEILN